MSDGFLKTLRRGTEEAFFAKESERLRQQLQDAKLGDAAQAGSSPTPEAAAPRGSAGIDEDSAALFLAPLVLMAWADGSVSEAERSLFLRAVEEAEPAQGSLGRSLAGWLDDKPGHDLFADWRSRVLAHCATMSPDVKAAFRERIMGNARDMATAAGGFLGLGAVSAAEKAALARLDDVLSD